MSAEALKKLVRILAESMPPAKVTVTVEHPLHPLGKPEEAVNSYSFESHGGAIFSRLVTAPEERGGRLLLTGNPLPPTMAFACATAEIYALLGAEVEPGVTLAALATVQLCNELIRSTGSSDHDALGKLTPERVLQALDATRELLTFELLSEIFSGARPAQIFGGGPK